jgi:hypothetical protein
MTVAIRKPMFGACVALALALPLSVTAADAPSLHADHGGQTNRPHRQPNTLVEKVRRATAKYRDIKVALYEHWTPATPCVSGPNTGAMGVHFVLPARLGDAAVYADAPEALIYEPQPDGSMRLVGVEFILFAANWATAHPEGGAPNLEGHLMNYVGAPNRYGLDAFYELHVWAWEDNPEGSFADWNTQVTCEHQPLAD